MATLNPLTYGKVVGRLLAVVADGPDEDEFPSGGFPDAVALAGSVTFTPRAKRVLVAGASPDPAIAFPAAITAQLDRYGYLTWNGRRGIFLLAPSAQMNPAAWTYEVKFDLTLDRVKIPAASFDMELVKYVPGPNPADPDAGSTAVDLATVAPVMTSPGTPVVVGPKGDTIQTITLSGDGSALVFHIDRSGVLNLVSVVIPALGDLVGAVADASTFAGIAGTAATLAVAGAEDASQFAGIAGTAAALAVDKAEEAASYVGGVLDGAVTTPKVLDDAITTPKVSPTIRVSLAKADSAVQPAALSGYQVSSARGAANGYAPLDGSAKVAAAFLPSYVDDVLEYANLAGFPATGEVGKMYTAIDTNKVYRWSGSVYVEISASPGSTDAVPEGAGNKYYTDARAQAANSGKYTKPGSGIPASDLAVGRVVGSANGTASNVTIWYGTEAQYAAIGSKDATTVYLRTS